LTDADTLEINVTADDPNVLTGTWKAPPTKRAGTAATPRWPRRR